VRQPRAKRKANRRPAHTALDARSWQSKLLRRTEAELLAHAGNTPSVTQKALCKRAAWLTVYLAELDAKATAGAFMSNHDSKVYLAWSNSLAKTLKAIGLKSAPPPPSVADAIAAAKARRTATA
jgi:hypothetical protein